MPDRCLPDPQYTVWEEWKACKAQQLAAAGWWASGGNRAAAAREVLARSLEEAGSAVPVALPEELEPFDAFILENRDHLPWNQNSTHTAVLNEVRPLERPIWFAVRNMMLNLPVHWRIQIMAGGQEVVDLMHRRFPVEVAAGKIVLTNIHTEQQTHVGGGGGNREMLGGRGVGIMMRTPPATAANANRSHLFHVCVSLCPKSLCGPLAVPFSIPPRPPSATSSRT